MKLLIISNMYPSEKQPEFAPFMKNMEAALAEKGIDVSKIVIAGKGRSFFEKIKKYGSFYCRMLACDLNAYDMIDLGYPSHTYWPLFFKRLGHSKLIVRLHGEDLVKSRLKESISLILGRKLFTVPSLRRAHMIVVPSNYFCDELKKRGIVSRIHIYPSGGVNRSNFFPAGQNHDLFTLGYVGRLAEGKGIDYLLKAAESLPFEHRILVVGNGPLKEKLEKMAQSLGLRNAEFAGAVPNEQLRSYYNQMDVFVFPTIMESFGIVAVEAMACGIPIIGSEISALQEYIKDGVNGYLFEAGNVPMLARKIQEFYLMDEAGKRRFQENAIMTAKQYDHEVLTARFVEALFSLVKDAPENKQRERRRRK